MAERSGTSHTVVGLVSFCLTGCLAHCPPCIAHIDQSLGPFGWSTPNMLLFASLLLLLLAPDLQARPQDCEIFDTCEPESLQEDPDCAIFDTCEEPPAPVSGPECEIFGDCENEEIEVDTRSDCFDSINEIDSLDNDGRLVRPM